MGKRRGPRPKMHIFYDILKSIQEELLNGEVKPTRVQFQSNLSYDNLMEHLIDLEKIEMISRNPLLPTEKGREFVKDYCKMTVYLKDLGLKMYTDIEVTP